MSPRAWVVLAASAVVLALPARAAASFSPGDGAIFTQPLPGAVVSVPYSWAVESPAACGAQNPNSSVARAFIQGPPDYLGGAAVPFSQASYQSASPNYSASGVRHLGAGSYR